MRKIPLILFLITAAVSVRAQSIIPFDFTSEDENRLIKENDSLKYFTATSDSANTVVMNEESFYYKLLNRERKVIAEGAYIVDGDKYLQDGKWVEKYDNGKTKITGYYHRNLPIGTWQEYYNTGKIKTISNYGVFLNNLAPVSCLSGSYQEFYPSGKIKINGFYAGSFVAHNDTVAIEDPVTGNKVYRVFNANHLRAEKISHWEYYNEAGEVDKKDD